MITLNFSMIKKTYYWLKNKFSRPCWNLVLSTIILILLLTSHPWTSSTTWRAWAPPQPCRGGTGRCLAAPPCPSGGSPSGGRPGGGGDYWGGGPVYISLVKFSTQKIHKEILSDQPEIRLYLPFPDWFEVKQTSVWFQINREMVKKIWFRVDLIRFRKDFSVCAFGSSTNDIAAVWEAGASRRHEGLT